MVTKTIKLQLLCKLECISGKNKHVFIRKKGKGYAYMAHKWNPASKQMHE